MSALLWTSAIVGYLLGWLVCMGIVARADAPPDNNPDGEEQIMAVALGLVVGMIWPVALLVLYVKGKVYR